MDTETLAEVLAAHQPRVLARNAEATPVTCKCGPGWDRDQHRTHAEHVATRIVQARAGEGATPADWHHACTCGIAHGWSLIVQHDEGCPFGTHLTAMLTAAGEGALRERVEVLASEWHGRATEATSEPLSWRRVARALRAALAETDQTNRTEQM